jgi:hypothetical protein
MVRCSNAVLWTGSTMSFFVSAMQMLRNCRAGNKGSDKQTFAKIPSGVNGLIWVDREVIGGLCSSFLPVLYPNAFRLLK